MPQKPRICAVCKYLFAFAPKEYPQTPVFCGFDEKFVTKIIVEIHRPEHRIQTSDAKT
jgi:hypothetical protein